jgi:hypothetical protein
MKAWIVYDTSEEWVSLFHADTSGKAKLRGLEEYNLDSFTDMRAKRLPELDNKPITYQNAKDAGFEYLDDGGKLEAMYFFNDCRCEICENEKQSR